MAKRMPDVVFSHWYKLMENLTHSPMAFYSSVENAIQRRQVPDIRLTRVEFKEGGLLAAKREYLRVTREKLAFDICGAPFGTGFFFSWWLTEVPPSYVILWVIGIIFVLLWLLDIFTKAFGMIPGFLLWLIALPFGIWFVGYLIREGKLGASAEDVVLAIPVLGRFYEGLFKPDTYYKIDTTLMFQSAISSAVMEAIDEITSAKGIRALSELERKPIMREFLK